MFCLQFLSYAREKPKNRKTAIKYPIKCSSSANSSDVGINNTEGNKSSMPSADSNLVMPQICCKSPFPRLHIYFFSFYEHFYARVCVYVCACDGMWPRPRCLFGGFANFIWKSAALFIVNYSRGFLISICVCVCVYIFSSVDSMEGAYSAA